MFQNLASPNYILNRYLPYRAVLVELKLSSISTVAKCI